jgi:DNA-binding HxlR family transcriptional regulator
MRDLLAGPKRFSELKKSLIGITSKTLSKRLAELGEAEVILRTAYPEVPARVLYSLTEKGRDFDQILEAVRSWGERWMHVEPR